MFAIGPFIIMYISICRNPASIHTISSPWKLESRLRPAKRMTKCNAWTYLRQIILRAIETETYVRNWMLSDKSASVDLLNKQNVRMTVLAMQTFALKVNLHFVDCNPFLFSFSMNSKRAFLPKQSLVHSIYTANRLHFSICFDLTSVC